MKPNIDRAYQCDSCDRTIDIGESLTRMSDGYWCEACIEESKRCVFRVGHGGEHLYVPMSHGPMVGECGHVKIRTEESHDLGGWDSNDLTAGLPSRG